MSYSSLWLVDKDFYGTEECEFGNSWLFAPQVWKFLEDKYDTSSVMLGQGFLPLNRIMNASSNMSERIAWEMTMQQAFFSKDITQIRKHLLSLDIGKPCNERILEMVSALGAVDPVAYPYFIFKNNSVDDGVERLFIAYDESKDECVPCSLARLDEVAFEFVVLSGHGMEFIDNMKFVNKNAAPVTGITKSGTSKT